MRNKYSLLFGVVLIVAFFVFVVFYLLETTEKTPAVSRQWSVGSLLSDNTSAKGYAQADKFREFRFPADHGPHSNFKHEWWYFTGNLFAKNGRRFGYQLTVFRNAISPMPIKNPSEWRTRQIYMAHFALTDIQNKRFHDFERFDRAALGLSGAIAQPFKVWLDTWMVKSEGVDTFPVRLSAVQDDIAVNLSLSRVKPIVLQGDRGLSQKGEGLGNASYYYSITRMPSIGTVKLGNQTFDVSGLSWMDREWGSGGLGKNVVGWDWFSLQFDDDRELMLYRLRNKDGKTNPFNYGTLVTANGSVHKLGVEDVKIVVEDTWESPATHIIYPARWRIMIPSEHISVQVVPYIHDQELKLSVRYWEGAVSVTGKSLDSKITGSGYVELTGYDESGIN